MIKLGFEIGVAAFVALLTFVTLFYIFVHLVSSYGRSKKEEKSDKVTKMPRKGD